MVASEEKAFDRVIQGPYPGREPELLGREDRSLRVQHNDPGNGLRVGEASLSTGSLVCNPCPVGPLRPGEGGRDCHLLRIAQLPRHSLGSIYDATSTNADQEIRRRRLRLDGRPLHRPTGGMLPDTGEGPCVPATEHSLDAADEAGLLVQAAPGDDEGPVVGPGLLFQLLQSIRAEMNARGLKEDVGAASHAPIVQLPAVPGDRTHVSLRELTPILILPTTPLKRTHVRFKVRG